MPCLLQSLDRPLVFEATSNTFSLQPGYGPNNPRIFILKGDLRLSVVPKGEGRPLLELSEQTEPGRSIKGELLFPIEGPLDHALPFDRILADSGTKCAFCHFGEERVDAIDWATAYASNIVEISGSQRVHLDYLTWVHEECDREREPDRCAMLDGVFGYGEVIEREPSQ